MAKSKKQDIINEEADFSNIKLAQTFNSLNTEPDNASNDKKGFNLVLSNEDALRFTKLHHYFVSETNVYKYSSKNEFLNCCIGYLIKYYEKKDLYKTADDGFIKMVTRKGRRPKCERNVDRSDAVFLFFRLEPLFYNGYYDLMFSFLNHKEDRFNKCYSASYFFYDFLNLVEKNFKAVINYGIRLNK